MHKRVVIIIKKNYALGLDDIILGKCKVMTRTNIYRHEIKYLVSPIQAKILENRMKLFAEIDNNSSEEGYQIRSLYFDDMAESAYFEKENGVNNRKKWRIRVYNYNMNTIKLECKHKVGTGIYKECEILSIQEYKKILQGKDLDFLKTREELLKNFYLELNEKRLKPKVIVDYERMPYVYKNGNVRITFDKNVRAGIGSYLIEDKKIPTQNVFSRGEIILEFKYTQYIPAIFQDILSHEVENEMAVSKYVMCVNKIKELYE